MGVSYSREAEDDLRALMMNGLNLFGYEQAARYRAEMRKVIALLEANPRLGREQKAGRRSLRLHPFRAHVIVYTETDGAVLILRILHARQDWLRHLL